MRNGFISVIDRAIERSVSASLVTDWLGKTIRLSDGGFWSSFGGSSSSSGQTVSESTALKLSAVWSCVRLISTSVAGLPFGVYQRLDDGGRKHARDFRLYDVLHSSPNEDMTAFHFWQAVVASMLLRGNAYCRIHWVGKRVVALDFLWPGRVTVKCDEQGRLTYRYREKAGGEDRPIPREEMLHIPAFSVDGRVGMSAIQFGAEVFGAAQAANIAASTTFKNGLMPAIAFKVDRILKGGQRDDFREYVEKVSGALNAGKAPVLEQGVTAEDIGINPKDSQLLESRAYGVEEICRWFGVPPWMVGHTDKGSNWGTGLEQQMIAFLTFSISSITSAIQQCVNKKCMTAEDRVRFYSEFSLEGFLKADSAARASFYSTMVQNGIYTRDDVREKENLPRRGGNSAVLTVQTNLIPIDKLGESSNEQQARNALIAWLNQDNNTPEPSRSSS